MFCIEIANSIAFLSRNSGRTLTMTCNGSTCIPATHVRRTIVPFDHTRVTKLLPQYKQRRTASRRSSTSQFRATGGSQAGATTFRLDDMNALRLHPRQVRTIDVERMKDVILQRSRLKTGKVKIRSGGVEEGTLAPFMTIRAHSKDWVGE